MFAEIVFPLPFRNSFTYSVPKEFEKDAVLVFVPLFHSVKELLPGS